MPLRHHTRQAAGTGSAAVYTPVKLGIITSTTPKAADITAFNASIAPRKTDLMMVFRGFNQPLAFASDKTDADSVGAQLIIAWQMTANPQGTGLNGTLGAVTGGALDAYMEVEAAKMVTYGKPVIVRLCHEFNGSWYTYGNTKESAASYVAGFKYVVEFMKAKGATNLKWCWNPNVWGLGGASIVDPTTYYPGDGYVDYIGLDGYMTLKEASVLQPSALFGPSMAGIPAISATKPVLICETGVAEDVRFSKPAWLTNLGIYAKGMFALCYFNRDRTPEGEGDFTLDSSGTNPAALTAFKAVVNNPRFV
jgi:mannan endo-1,4-beta-mannosidase